MARRLTLAPGSLSKVCSGEAVHQDGKKVRRERLSSGSEVSAASLRGKSEHEVLFSNSVAASPILGFSSFGSRFWILDEEDNSDEESMDSEQEREPAVAARVEVEREADDSLVQNALRKELRVEEIVKSGELLRRSKLPKALSFSRRTKLRRETSLALKVEHGYGKCKPWKGKGHCRGLGPRNYP
uniref:Uncharacterized protein n=1 Tax=Oryza brachyantha TaxID=4533 RepID=J3MDI1_ORYBR